jgi:MFS-type transporter involved in bile tolerance (Atg22 family)
MIVFAMFMTLVQSNVEDHLRGRVVSIYSLAFRGAMPLGNLVAGIAASLLSAPVVLVADGLILLVLGGIVLLRSNPEGMTAL